MTDWQQQIEAQIALVRQESLSCYGHGIIDAGVFEDAADTMQALLDTAVAAEKMADFIVDYDGCDGGVWREFWDALDKLQEVSDG